MNTLTQKLYHIKHNVTGKCYLGQTTKAGRAWDNYFGSSVPFNKHMEQYGKDVTKEILFESSDQKEFADMCVQISQGLDVVNNSVYFNQIHEHGGNLGGAANPNHKDGKWVGRHGDKELERRVQKEADVIKYERNKELFIKFQMNARYHKSRGNREKAFYWFNKWQAGISGEDPNGKSLQKTDTFEFWYQCVGSMNWEKRKAWEGKENDV